LSADPVARMNSLYGLNDKQFTYKKMKIIDNKSELIVIAKLLEKNLQT